MKIFTSDAKKGPYWTTRTWATANFGLGAAILQVICEDTSCLHYETSTRRKNTSRAQASYNQIWGWWWYWAAPQKTGWRDQPSATGKEIADQEFSSTILESLPEAYGSFSTMLDVSGKEYSISVQKVQTQLLQMASREKRHGATAASGTSSGEWGASLQPSTIVQWHLCILSRRLSCWLAQQGGDTVPISYYRLQN